LKHGHWIGEAEARRQDGSKFWFQLNANVVHDPETGAPLAWMASLRDVTQQRHTAKVLKESETRLANAQRIAHLGDWEFNVLTEEFTFSDELYRLLNRSKEFGTSTLEFAESVIDPLDFPRVRRAIQVSLSSPTAPPYAVDYRVKMPDGSTRFFHSQGEVLFDERGKAVKFTGTVQDISDRRNSEERLRQAQKMETVGQLTGGIAHDFNNLLMAIQFGTEFARSSVSSAEADEHFNMVLDATQRGAELVRRLSVFSRQQDLEPKVVDPGQLIRQALQLIRAALPENITTEVQVGDTASNINVDAGQMENALLNLAINARDAMPGGGKLIFQVCDTADGLVEISVTDAGIGMSPEVRARALEPFFTTKELGKGTGLGLSMVYGFVTQSGGTLGIDSEEGKGTTIRKLFPHAAGSPDAVTKRRADALDEGSSLGNVILVDDERGVRKALETLLKCRSKQLIVAANGAEGMDAITQTGHVDLFISDVVLPGIVSGFDLADEVTKRHAKCRVLLISGYSTEAQRARSTTKAYRMLQKPFTTQTFLSELEALQPGRPH
jgi:signal transduction histidine kinase